MVNSTSNPRTVTGSTAAPSRSAPRITEELRDPLVVVSGDAALIAEVRRIAVPHPLRTVPTDAGLSQTLRECPGAVTLLDTAFVTRAPLARLTARLKLQFPDLAVLVLGDSEDYAALTDQLSRDIIFGFLEKPAPLTRLHQMLGRAWLRHQTPAKNEPEDHNGARQYLTLGAVVLCLIAAVASGAYAIRAWVRSYGPPPAVTAPLPPESPTERLLSRADAAVAAGAFENATELYRQAQKLAPGNPRVAQGVSLLLRQLLAASQTQLLDQHLGRAQTLAKLAVSLAPDNPLVTHLVTQISTVQAGAATHNASQNDTADSDPGVHKVRIEETLRQTEELMRQKHLIEPPRDNAYAALERARQSAPDDPRVLELQKELVQMMLDAGRRAAAAGHAEDVLRYVGPVQELGALPRDIARMESRTAPGKNLLERSAAAFNERLLQGKIIDPPGDSAKFYLAQLVKIDPNSTASQIARLALGQRLIAEAHSAVRHQDYLVARRWLVEARQAGVDATSIGNVESALAAAWAQSRSTEQPPLYQTHRVEPDYPAAAFAKHVTGSVDVQFTVFSDGSTGELEVITATPAGVFERAALDAVGQWRYRPPVLKDGSPTRVRAEVTVSFTR